jgi:hypothetical protein
MMMLTSMKTTAQNSTLPPAQETAHTPTPRLDYWRTAHPSKAALRFTDGTLCAYDVAKKVDILFAAIDSLNAECGYILHLVTTNAKKRLTVLDRHEIREAALRGMTAHKEARAALQSAKE